MQLDYIKCGDSLKLIKEIPDNSVDLVVTDPPYEKKGNGYYRGGANSEVKIGVIIHS